MFLEPLHKISHLWQLLCCSFGFTAYNSDEVRHSHIVIKPGFTKDSPVKTFDKLSIVQRNDKHYMIEWFCYFCFMEASALTYNDITNSNMKVSYEKQRQTENLKRKTSQTIPKYVKLL